MEATLQALGGILLRAIPTIILVILLHFYLKYIFFKPLGKVLHQRFEATEGARRLAEETLERAAAKAAEYEAALRKARAEVYEAQEESHKLLQESHEAALRQAREGAEAATREARAQLAADVEQAKTGLARDAEALSAQIADSLLRRSVA